jgi:hypothetical protein
MVKCNLIIDMRGAPAETYRFLGRLSQAGKIQPEMLKAQKATVGEHHPNTVTALRDTHSEYQRCKGLKYRLLNHGTLPVVSLTSPEVT